MLTRYFTKDQPPTEDRDSFLEEAEREIENERRRKIKQYGSEDVVAVRFERTVLVQLRAHNAGDITRLDRQVATHLEKRGDVSILTDAELQRAVAQQRVEQDERRRRSRARVKVRFNRAAHRYNAGEIGGLHPDAARPLIESGAVSLLDTWPAEFQPPPAPNPDRAAELLRVVEATLV